MKINALHAFCSTLLWVFLFTPDVFSQVTGPDAIMGLKEENVPAYDTSVCQTCIFLQVEYGSTQFLNMDVLKRFEDKDIESVEMVYSSFSRSKSFDQAALNRSRLNSLLAVAPELFSSDIRWSLVRQTACNSVEESERLFHGFVVRLPAGSAKRDTDGTLVPVEVVKTEKPKAPKMVWRDSTITRSYVNVIKSEKRECEPTGKFLPRNKKKRKAGVRYDDETALLFWKRKAEKRCSTVVSYKRDTIFQKIKVKVNPITGKFRDESLYADRSDNTVPEVLERNWENWKKDKSIVVQDVTGSMSVYLDQTLMFQEQYAANGVEHYVFFNDGDDKPDSKKALGKTGGLYYIQSKNINEIQETANRAMSKGSGGDLPENNVEAILYAQDKCKDCQKIIMVADNYAPVKDLKLLGKVKKPVQVILCGVQENDVLDDYITLAAVTKGSLHTGTLDLLLETAVENKEKITIGPNTYVFKNGRYQIDY